MKGTFSPVIERIEPDALRFLLNVPEEDRRDLPPAMLLPAEPDAEPDLTAELGRRWGELAWRGLGTWFDTPSAPGKGFDDRYPGLVEKVVARTTSATPRGLVARSEWAFLDSSAAELHQFVADVRRSRSGGSCLLVLPADADARVWYAPTLPLVHRPLLAFESAPGMDTSAASRESALSFLRAVASSGFAALVPLNLHPWGGYVVIGDESFLTHLAELLADVSVGLADVTVDQVLSRAGRAAL
ncbi:MULTISPECIES: hypothetical protein [unclassified Isoptericola]|uniref:hypothetical protein n=1 Tax=Isoptericola sp. NPDC060185 TaxID=3347065 RepID=UPI00365164E4